VSPLRGYEVLRGGILFSVASLTLDHGYLRGSATRLGIIGG
jgi:hypothetical protein